MFYARQQLGVLFSKTRIYLWQRRKIVQQKQRMTLEKEHITLENKARQRKTRVLKPNAMVNGDGQRKLALYVYSKSY